MSGGPGLLLSSLPGTLGRTPAGETLMVAISDANPGTAAIYRVPLSVSAAEATERCRMAVDHAAASGATTVVIVTYPAADSGGPAAELTAASLVVLAEHAHLHVLDALRVVGDRWWSYECSEPSCCPPEGNPIPTPTEETP